MTVSAFAPGKIILLGEHAVVYGTAAIAGALSVGVTAHVAPEFRFNIAVPPSLSPEQGQLLVRAVSAGAKMIGQPRARIWFESQLPVSVGLGSSAALAVASSRALFAAAGKKPDEGRLRSAALAMEKQFHGTPSGIDHETCLRGGVIVFKKGVARSLPCKKPLKLVVALAGRRGPTHAVVAELRKRRDRWPRRYRGVIEQVGAVALSGADAIRTGDLRALGDVMNMNHGLLCALGVSSAPIDDMVHRLRALGALGAKLTGAGGTGGAVIGLFENPDVAVATLKNEGVATFAAEVGARSRA